MFSDFFTYSHLAGILSGVAGFLFFGWIIFRTRSWYVLKYFLWRTFHGKNGAADPIIKTYLGEQASLMLFRFVAVDAETNRDAHEMIQWSRERNIGLETVGQAGDYFDAKNRCIKEQKTRFLSFDRKAFAILSVVLILLMLPVFLSLTTSRAILVFKESGQWFLLGQDDAKTLFVHGSEALERDQCGMPKRGGEVRTGFTEGDAVTLCKIWQDPKTSAYIERTVHQQRVGGGWLLLVLGVLSLRCWRGMGKAKAAQMVHQRLSVA